jgi:hypothetical protein
MSASELSEFEIGYLAGLVDGEGYIFVHHDKRSDRTYPDLRIYCTSKPIIEKACGIMGVNPYVRRDRGKQVGWIAAVQGEKAMVNLRRIASHLTDASKKCRALTILKVFDKVSIIGKHRSSEVFSHCPPPARLRTRRNQWKGNSIERRGVAENDAGWASGNLRLYQDLAPRTFLDMSDVQKGWLCGLVDGEGYIHIRYRSDRDTMYPRLRIFVKSTPIIITAARLMVVNPYARRSHGKQLGWYASVSHLKALKVLRLIAPHLLEPSKKCRARKILDRFGNIGSIQSRLITSEFFAGCPPPARIRTYRRIIKSR